MKFLLLIASVVLLVNVSAAQVCDKRGRKCLTGEATCVNSKCVCNGGKKGDGAFGCYKQSQVAAEVLNDPVLNTFNNESIVFPFPCRYLTTHFINDMIGADGNKVGTCEFMIYSYNAKKRGKFFLHGYDVATHLRYKNGNSVKFSSRHFGVAKYGVTYFKNKGWLGVFYQNGPWRRDRIRYEDEVNGVEIKETGDRENNQHIYLAEQCGLKITFVPYDLKERRAQVNIPGISIAVDTSHDTKWLSRDEVVALPPGVTLAEKQITHLTIEQSMFVRAFKTEFVQNQPMKDKGKCDAVHVSFEKCTRPEVRVAMANCYWMLNQPRFMFCFDKSRSARNILRLFSSCIRAHCAGESCSKVQDMIIETGCDNVRDIPELPPFMASTDCTIPSLS